MLTKTKNVLIGLLLASALSGCAAQTSSGGMSAMKMDFSMCKKMMGEKKCCCCQQMQCMDSMRTSGMMTGGMPTMMDCKGMAGEQKTPVQKPLAEKPKASDADHKEHHPEKQ